MARSFRLFRQTTARFRTIESAVHEQLVDAAETQGVDVDEEGLTGEQTDRLFDTRFEWEIRSAAEHYVVVEKQYITTSWFVLFGVILLFGVFGAFLPSRGTIIVTAIALPLVVVWIRPFFTFSPIDATIDSNEEVKTNPAPGVVFIVAVPLVLGTAYSLLLVFTVLPEFWPVAFLLGITVVVFYLMFRQQSSFRQFDPDQMPHLYELLGGYLLLLEMSVVPAVGLLVGRPVLYPDPRHGPLIYVLFSLLSILVLVCLYWYTSQRRVFAYYSFLAGKETIDRPLLRLPMLAFLGGAAYGILYIFVRLWQSYPVPPPVDRPLLGAAIFIAILPVLYIPVGVGLQTFAFLRETISLFVRSRPAPVEAGVDINPQIRLLETPDYIAGSYSTGFRDYVFISNGLITALETDELGAVLAHEEGHVENRDALLSFILPILALFLFTGKNVLYTVLDFRTREFVADTYAARRVGQDPLKRALQKLASAADGEPTERWSATTPTFTSFTTYSDPGIVDRYFGTFFGNFALTEAHPSMAERIKRIEAGTGPEGN